MIRKQIIALILTIAAFGSAGAQTAVESLAGLLDNAHSVVINNETDFVCESPTSAVKKQKLWIMIVNEKGKEEGNFITTCDKFSSLRKFSGEICDKTGKTIRKIKKSDLKMTEYSDGLADDNVTYYYECNGPSYPYIVKYEWEIKYRDGLIMFPSFVPQRSFNQSVATATYRITVPKEMNYKYKTINTDIVPEEKTSPEGITYREVNVNNLKAWEREPYGPGIGQLIPLFYFSPVAFFFDGTEGSMESWHTYGLWLHKLLKDRNTLPGPLKQKLKEMTATCSTDREKVKAVYDYLAETTRYVSIQLGIGGLQPMPAMEVSKTGFSDCKGLTNYVMAMLNELGIDSYYTVISTTNRRLIKDYASANQMNHVILQVPLANDTLWLECTNPQLPFGYVHDDIAGHDALLIKETGGEICRLPAYPDSVNTQATVAHVTLEASGKAAIEVCQSSRASQYESLFGFKKLSPDKQKELLRSGLQLNRATLNNITINETKQANPAIDICYRIDCEQYGSKTGNRLFIPVNVFRDRFGNLNPKQRKHDIYINYGYMDTDTIHIRIPEGYKIESLPKPASISCRFGRFETSLKVEQGDLQIIHSLLLKTGKYPADTYEEFAGFNKAISEQYKGKIILRKE